METNEFDLEFQHLSTKMVEIAFEFTGFNKEEVDTVYIFSSLEAGSFFFNVFYRINGVLVKNHQINSVLKKKVDDSDDRAFNLLRLGSQYVQSIVGLFKANKRALPTAMKMVYEPKTNNFKNNITYELQFSHRPDSSNVEVFNAWYNQIKLNH